MLAFDLYILLGLIALVVLAVTAVVLVLLVLVVHAGLSAVWRWVTQGIPHRADEPRPRR